MASEIISIHSPSHKIRTKKTETNAVVELECMGSSEWGGVFNLYVRLKDAHAPRMWVEKHPKKDSEACMLTFYPEFEVKLANDTEIVLMLDASNSMTGSAFQDAIRVCLLLLHELSSESDKQFRFNLVAFGSFFKELYPKSKPLTRSAAAQAEAFLKKISPDMGNTDLRSLLRTYNVLTSSQVNVFVVSDGHIGEEGLVTSLSARDFRVRVFTFATSQTANKHLLRTISNRTGGAFENFDPTETHVWREKIKRQVERAQQPALSNISVEWQQFKDVDEIAQAPQKITSLFSGDCLVVYGFVSNCTMATLKASLQQQEFSTVVSTSELNKTNGTLIHSLVARGIVRDWEDGPLDDDSAVHWLRKRNSRSLVVELAKQHSLVTSLTSFLAVEKRREGEVIEDVPQISELLTQENVDILPYMEYEDFHTQEKPVELDDAGKMDWEQVTSSSDRLGVGIRRHRKIYIDESADEAFEEYYRRKCSKRDSSDMEKPLYLKIHPQKKQSLPISQEALSPSGEFVRPSLLAVEKLPEPRPRQAKKKLPLSLEETWIADDSRSPQREMSRLDFISDIPDQITSPSGHSDTSSDEDLVLSFFEESEVVQQDCSLKEQPQIQDKLEMFFTENSPRIQAKLDMPMSSSVLGTVPESTLEAQVFAGSQAPRTFFAMRSQRRDLPHVHKMSGAMKERTLEKRLLIPSLEADESTSVLKQQTPKPLPQSIAPYRPMPCPTGALFGAATQPNLTSQTRLQQTGRSRSVAAQDPFQPKPGMSQEVPVSVFGVRNFVPLAEIWDTSEITLDDGAVEQMEHSAENLLDLSEASQSPSYYRAAHSRSFAYPYRSGANIQQQAQVQNLGETMPTTFSFGTLEPPPPPPDYRGLQGFQSSKKSSTPFAFGESATQIKKKKKKTIAERTRDLMDEARPLDTRKQIQVRLPGSIIGSAKQFPSEAMAFVETVISWKGGGLPICSALLAETKKMAHGRGMSLTEFRKCINDADDETKKLASYSFDCSIIRNLLEEYGLHSLGEVISEQVVSLVHKLFCLFTFLFEKVFPEALKSQEASDFDAIIRKSSNILARHYSFLKLLMEVNEINMKYPLIYSNLELGKSWESFLMKEVFYFGS